MFFDLGVIKAKQQEPIAELKLHTYDLINIFDKHFQAHFILGGRAFCVSAFVSRHQKLLSYQ